MRAGTRPLSAAAALALAGAILAACGSSSGPARLAQGAALGTAGIQSPLTESLDGASGGKLSVLHESDFEHLDPGIAYYGLDYTIVYATQRPLYSNAPNTSAQPRPDLAAGPPQISADARTITIPLRTGVRFSPPVNREVTSQDVAYALERGANPNVANPYFQAYFASIEGATKATGGPMAGIRTPDAHTIVLHLTEPKAQLVANALVLPLSAAVPKEYAARFDAHSPSDYGNYQVATGPYMLKNDPSGKVLGIGYVPGRSATLVRNPNWSRASDIRPAYLDEIDVKIGGSNAVIGRQVLEGSDIVENEAPAQAIVKEAFLRAKDQLQISPGAGSDYVAVNNKTGPFASADVRRALWAALDRTAMVKARGGALVGTVATHFIYPTIPGFEEAGGVAGPQLDYNVHPEGDAALAARYMRLAGYPSGRYTGGKTITVVGSRGTPSEQDAEIVNKTLGDLGFKTHFVLVDSSTMYGKYCGVPSEEIDVCPSVGWIADFADPQAVLNLAFNGHLITPSGNSNWSQTDVPSINAAMAAAEDLTGEQARATAWAQIDVALVKEAAAVPFAWEKQASIEGHGVKGVGDLWNSGKWDYSWTSLK